ncbi:FecR family protein [Chitinophaga sp. 212800010-3]|uniref:FecR family protein n=1 Tax=unclassified Chitinophaga TaxID=2619133 RepID=UPI002DE5DA92|nr:FecR family protein [Chitinophaga sp. 212800010-3]
MEEKDFDFNLIVRFIEGNADAAERVLVQEWVNSNEQHKQLFFQVKDILDYEYIKGISPEQTARRWQAVSAALQPVHATRKKASVWPRIAAAAAILLVIGVAAWFFRRSSPATPVVLVNNEAAPLHAVLPDSTGVWLLKGATLSYERSNARKVALKGTAYFEVTRKAENPFTVDLQQMNIVVLGTSFIVNSSPAMASAAVSDGMVKAVLPGKEWVLKQDEGVFYENGTATRQTVHSSYYRMMKEGFFDFNNTSVTEIAEIIKVVYGYQVVVRNPEVLEQNSISGHVAISDEAGLYKVISIMMHVDVIKNNQQIVIQPKLK